MRLFVTHVEQPRSPALVEHTAHCMALLMTRLQNVERESKPKLRLIKTQASTERKVPGSRF